MNDCLICSGIGAIISLRDDGIYAVEACGVCASIGDDNHAAEVACRILHAAGRLRWDADNDENERRKRRKKHKESRVRAKAAGAENES